MKKTFYYLFLLLMFPTLLHAQTETTDHRQKVRLETTVGNITIALSDSTPVHRDNFIRLAREGYYDSLLFHRVIEDFMIQTGDPDSRHARPGDYLGEGGPDYTLPAEIRLPDLYHFRGAVAAAREGDDVNPEHRSSGSQFYIVWGKPCNNGVIKRARHILEEASEGQYTVTPEMATRYQEQGGTPHLDGGYTVFGEVVEGLDDVVYQIQMAMTDDNDRPYQDIRILKAIVLTDEQENDKP